MTPTPTPPQPAASLQIVDTPRFRAVLLASICLLVLGLYFFADRLALRTEQDALHRLAKSHADLLISFRKFYSARLLPIIREHSNLVITHDYRERPGALPIPATMTLDLVEEIARSNPEMNLRLVSGHPFPWRKVSLDAFEVEALAALQASGHHEFLRLEDSPRGKVLRYAAPIRLDASCVGCHNGHPDSPKRDWKEGDVRGIQVMTLSLEGLSFDNHPQHFFFATLLLLAFGAAGSVLIWLHGRNVRAVRQAQLYADGLRDRQRALDAHAIVSITDREGRILYANEQFCAISGYRPEELMGQNHRILKSGLHPDSFYAEMWATMVRGEVWEGEICNRKKDGGFYWVKSTVVPFLDADGFPRQYIAIRTDITARKLVESELMARRAEAEAASRAKSDFLANMSHEIRTPMNGIIGMTDLALEADSEIERQEYLEIVKNSAESLLGILNDILDFSKIEANKLMLEQVAFDLRQALSETLRTLNPRAFQKGLELICDIADEVPLRVIGDPTRLRQVLINLVGNAIKFTNQGHIVVRLEVAARDGARITLRTTVRDTGIGIAPEKLDSIFEAFSQADVSTTRQYGGTGLGLSISSRLVELMEGALRVESTPGEGSAFEFTVVLGLDERSPGLLPAPVLAGRRVLIVDDHPVCRAVFARQLAGWGMQVEALASAAAARAWLAGEAHCPDLCLIDQHLPAREGLELAAWCRAQPGLAAVPLLFLASAPLPREDAEWVRDLGPVGSLGKPLSDLELRAAILRTLGLEGGEVADAGQTLRPPLPLGGALEVLLVEDNPVNQQLAMRLLEKWGCQVTLAVHGQEAVDRLCAGERYDLVLMDRQMPVMGGIEATRLIRAHEAEHGLARVPIMAMTANAMQGDRERCLEAGMDDYVSKPINQVELAGKLRQFVPGGAAAQEARTAGAPAAVDEVLALPFDYAAALARMDPEMVEILAPAFRTHYAGELAALRAGVADGDAAEAMRRAHGLKGTLAAFGADPAARRAAEIETLADAGDLTALPPLLIRLEEELARLLAVLPGGPAD